jgi:Ca2+-binding RTX toxin-like protein
MASNLFNINVNDPLNGNVSNIANQDWYTADGTTTSPVSAYQYDAYNLLFSTELSGWEVNSAQNPYQLDLTVSDVNGDPTIGIGIDLHTNSGALTSYFNVPAGAEHNALAAQYASPAAYNAGLANGGATGFTITAAQSEAAFKHYEQVEETKIDSVLYEEDPNTAGSAPVVGSTARLALLDLAYNSTLFSPSKSPTLFSDLANGNQADAWFQIAFNSNDYSGTGAATSASPSANTARRWEDAALIGLYNNSDTTPQSKLNDALSTYAMLSSNTNHHGESNRAFAFNYSNAFATAIGTVSSTDTSQSLYALTNNNINGQLGAEGLSPLQTGDLEANLKQAATTLVQTYVFDAAQNPYANESLYSSTTFDSLDVQVATISGSNHLVASHRDGYNLAPSGNDTNAHDYSSLLIAQGGSDTLDDSASSANDVLIGCTGTGNDKGNDTFYVGSGNDYIVAGTGNALIEGGPSGGAIGGGNDTIVLGPANTPWKGGDDTVWGGSGNDVYYLGLQSQTAHIHLGSGHSTINVVYSPTDIAALGIDATGLGSDPFSTVSSGESLYEDETHHELVISTLNPDGTKHLEIIDLSPPVANTPGQATRTRSLAATAVGIGTTATTGELIIDGYTGNNLSGIQLTSGPTQTIQSSNLSQLYQSSPNVYEDSVGLDSVYGSNTSGSTNGNVIDGQGKAQYIYAGNGNNDVFTGEEIDSATTAWATAFNVSVQGGAGNQYLVGFGNSNETIVGGDVGQDTTAWDTIDGGGGNGLLEGGTQNSAIYGGTGQDTLIAGSGTASGYNPESFLLAGQSFWNGGGVEPGWSTPGGTAANFQVTLTNSTQSIILLGSYLDPATATTPTLPGSLLIGGTGYDTLIGNQGNDTLIGGTPLHSVSGVTDEILVGGAGADLIYGGDGNEWIFADMPATVANWADADPTDADTIYGGSGNDVIYGSGGNNEIYGGAGNYSIYVGNGSSYVDTGSGTAIVYGGIGSDTLVADGSVDQIYSGTGNALIQAEGDQTTITLQGGNDTVALDAGNTSVIEGSGATTLVTGLSTGSSVIQPGSQGTTIQLTDGLSEADVSLTNVNGDLVIYDADLGGQITVSGYFTNSSGNVSLQFADGTTWGASQLGQQVIVQGVQQVLQQATLKTAIEGTTGSDTLSGTYGADLIDGQGGGDYVDGGQNGNDSSGNGNGSDVFVFNPGYGQLDINEFYVDGQLPVVLLGQGIDESALKVTVMPGSYNLLVTDGIAGDAITLDEMAPDADYLGTNHTVHYGVAAIAMADGTILTRDQIFQLEVAGGTAGNDYLEGTTGAELIDGKGGNDYVEGNGGNDTFVFNVGYGQLEIREKYTSGQQPILQLGSGITVSSLHVVNSGQSLVLTDGTNGDIVTLDAEGVDVGYGVAEVMLADGTTLSDSQLRQMALAGTTGNDTITGTYGADFIDGKGGNDSVVGEGGSDTFVFNSGYGHLEISESYYGSDQPVLQLGAGIAASSLHVTESTNNLIVTDGVAGDQITLDNMWSTSTDGVSEVTFADGTTLTGAQLIQMEMTGTTGSDTLYGTSGADLIDGKGGNDSVIGNGGNDTFVFNAGYGHLEINESYKSGQVPVLQLGAGIAASALNASKSGNNLLLTDGVSGDQITLDNMWTTATAGVAGVQLSNGTTLTRAQILALAMTGTTGSDTLTGTSGADLIDGKGGNDSVVGGGGNDTFVFN